MHGAKSERFVSNEALVATQLPLGLTLEPTAEPVVEVQVEKRWYMCPLQKNPQADIMAEILPPHLKRVEIVIETTEDTSGLVCLGYEVTEELEYEKGKLFVNQFKRAKYALPVASEKTKILMGELPVRPIERAIAGSALLTYIIISKFCDHLPCYRQIQMFQRLGVTISPATINDWIAAHCDLLQPLYDLLKQN